MFFKRDFIHRNAKNFNGCSMQNNKIGLKNGETKKDAMVGETSKCLIIIHELIHKLVLRRNIVFN